jgi:hypothetical protein
VRGRSAAGFAAWLLGVLLGVMPLMTPAAEPDLSLPPLTGDELPSFASVAQPPALAGVETPELSGQPSDATAAIPDDPASRQLSIPPELLEQQLPPAPEGRPRLGPDYLEIQGSPEYSKGIVRIKGGGVRLFINSLVAGTTITVYADSAIYNTLTGEAELSGGVMLEVPSVQLRLDCSYFNYDPLMERMHIEGAQLKLPLGLLPPGVLAERSIRPGFTGHFYTPDPEYIYVKTALGLIDYNPRRRAFEMSEVRLTTSSHPNPGFYLQARNLSIGQDNRLRLTGIAVHMSGLKLLAWPSYKRGPRKEAQPLSFGFPSVSVDRNEGLSWKQPVTLNFGHYQAEGVADYADEYGLLLSTRITQEISPGFNFTLRSGVRNVSGLDRERIERGDSLVSELSYDVKQPADGVERLRLNAEYGEVTATTPRRPGQPEISQVEATRLAASGMIDFSPVLLGNGVFMTFGGRASYVDYGGLDDHYSVYGGEAGLVLPSPHDDFNNYIVYRYRETDGNPRMGFDEVRREELDFAGQLKLQPGWRQTLHGVYDIDKQLFDTLELGAMRRQRSYELGMYYDFARESAGLELGLLVD